MYVRIDSAAKLQKFKKSVLDYFIHLRRNFAKLSQLSRPFLINIECTLIQGSLISLFELYSRYVAFMSTRTTD